MSKICFLDTKSLVKPSSGYAFHSGKNTKASRQGNPKEPIKLDLFRRNKAGCVFSHIDLCIDETNEFRETKLAKLYHVGYGKC